jgi:hypothetical protein
MLSGSRPAKDRSLIEVEHGRFELDMDVIDFIE